MSSKGRFLRPYFKLKIYLYFALRGVFFGRYVQVKKSFSDEKILAVKSETHFSREAIKV